MACNKKEGNQFEAEFCEILAKYGYWAHRINEGKTGKQPADIFAVKNNKPFLIDCKLCHTDGFDLSRIEPNQLSAMGLWYNKGNNNAVFVIKTPDGTIRVMSYQTAAHLMKTSTSNSIDKKHLFDITLPYEEYFQWI